MALTNTKVFPKSLDRDINKLFFDAYIEYPREYQQVAKIETAPPGNHYREAELSPLGQLRELPEGEGIQFDLPVEGNDKTVYYTKYGLGFQITEEMMADDLFGNFKKMPKKLAKSAVQKQETVFWDLFNSGFTSQTAWDGNYVFSTSHAGLKDGGSLANKPATDGALSETTLQAGFEYFWNLKDQAGMPITMEPWLLVTPVKLRWLVMKLWKTEGVVGSANNDINTVNPSQNPDLPGWKPFLSRYLTSDTAWFLIAKDHDMRFYWKKKPALESSDDFATGNALFKVTERMAAFVMNYQGVYGNVGA